MRAPLTTLRLAGTAAFCASLLALTSACTPDSPPGSPPTSSGPATPVESSTPTPSQSQEDKDKAEAVAAYREANHLVDSALTKEGKKALPKDLESVADPGGPWYMNQADGIERYNEEGLRFDKETTVVEARTAKYSSPDRIILFVCADGRDVKILDKNGNVSGETIMAAGYLTIRRSDGYGWRVFGYDQRGLVEVTTCSEGELKPSDVPS